MTNTARHTPGTWSVHKSQTSNAYLVLADDDLIVAADITNKSDADLLAASKEIYEDLRFFAEIGIGSNPDYLPTIRLPREEILKARAAIIKAQGE